MAFPAVASTSQTDSPTNTTSHTLVLPATCPANALIVCCVTTDGGAATCTFDTTYGAWTELGFRGVTEVKLAVWVKVATGGEAGNTLPITLSSSQNLGAITFAVTDWYGTLADGVSMTDTGSNPGSGSGINHTPLWGAADNLWISAIGIDAAPGITTFQSAFTLNRIDETVGSATHGITGACAAEKVNTATYGGGSAWTYPNSTTLASARATISVRPSVVTSRAGFKGLLAGGRAQSMLIS